MFQLSEKLTKSKQFQPAGMAGPSPRSIISWECLFWVHGNPVITILLWRIPQDWSCAPEFKFPGTFGSGATSGDPAPDPKFPETVGSAGANKTFKLFVGAVQTLPRTKHGGLQADLLGGLGGHSPPSEKTV